MQLVEVKEQSLKQLINSRSLLPALEQAQTDAAHYRGSMFWVKKSGIHYLVRTSANGRQHYLGPQNDATVQIFEKWITAKEVARSRLKELSARFSEQQKLNRVFGVGRAPDIMVRLLTRLQETDLLKNFMVIGTNALYAYESAAGVIFPDKAMETVDVDMLWDTRKRISFYTSLQRVGGSVIGLLQSVDPTFRKREDQPYTAVNAAGYEVDVIRRDPSWGDPELLSLGLVEGDLVAAKASQAGKILAAGVFESLAVATTGRVARMRTIAPTDFIRFKRWLADQPDRDPLKRRRDRLQADLVDELVRNYLGNLDGGKSTWGL